MPVFRLGPCVPRVVFQLSLDTSLATSHEVRPPTWPSREPPDLSGLQPDGPPWASLGFGHLRPPPGLTAFYFSDQEQGKMHLWALLPWKKCSLHMPLPGLWKEKKSEPEGWWLLERVLPFLLSFFFPLVGAGLLLHWVVVAASIPQGLCGSNYRHNCLAVSGNCHLPHGRG